MKKVFITLVTMAVTTSIFAQNSNAQPSAGFPADSDIARSAHYLTDIEKDVVLEINKARLNPKKYADEVITPILKTFVDNPWKDPLIRKKGDTWLSTEEGKAVIYELIEELNNTAPMQILYPSEGMSQAAKSHTKDCSSHNKTGHNGSDGSHFWDRVNRYGKIDLTENGGGECLSYGSNTGVDIVVQLLVDDGVKSRGHRKILLNPNSSKIGVGYGTHPTWNYMCTVDLAYNYSESK